ncbi:HAD family hydrolase [Vagococcus carniphilus]|uniref:HAD family hydrolase n=1 Tax=Vagococcus carniphilus TaxID=218144 RepID=UPI00288F60E8|nr:HAD family hydrolase [Vagococcus carniphilus]MDT2866219.1 HAD family hydrolase [Vagococcus carniphilus]
MKTVIFDVDDTLYDQIEPFKRAMIEVFPSEYEKLSSKKEALYLRFRYYSDKVFHLTEDGSLSLEDMRVYRITEALKDFSFSVSEDSAKKFQESYHYYQGKIELRDDVFELLDDLNSKQVPVGILTNGPTNHQKQKIVQLGLSSFLDEGKVFISEEMGVAKPDVLAFRNIEETFETHPKNCIYIGDSYENDVIGAKSAGWYVIWLNKYGRKLNETDIKPDVELSDYSLLKEEILLKKEVD